MATHKSFINCLIHQDFANLSCDICGSEDIVDTGTSYVCRACGVVSEVQKLQYDRPYNKDLLQHSLGLGETQLGNKRERLSSPNSSGLNRLSKHNSSKDNEKAVLDEAHIEISRLFTCLDLTNHHDIKQMVYDKFKLVRNAVRPGSKFRNVRKLVSIVAYVCFKLRAVPVNASAIIESGSLTKKEFNAFLMLSSRYLPRATEVERRLYISQRISDIASTFELGMPFYFYSKRILDKFWSRIKNTTDNVVAGLVCSIALLTSYKGPVNISSICNRLDIKMSTIQLQVKERVIARLCDEGNFSTLIKSADLLREVVTRLGLLHDNDNLDMSGVEDDDTVEIVVGKAQDIFNNKDTSDYYNFIFTSIEHITKEILQSDGSFSRAGPIFNEPYFDVSKLDLNIVMHHNSKGPPN